MSVVNHFIEDSMKKTEIDEFLQCEFERAGYGGVSISKTPLGTHLVVYTMRPGLVIGRGGETIRALAQVLEEKFMLPSPQISVAEIEVPELNAYVVASRISSALKRGIHYRRAGFWAITQAMQAGALGIEIVISGKLRTDRARYEKFSEGYLPKSGDPPRKYMRKAVLHVHLKPGTLGVQVSLLPPDAVFPDKIEVYTIKDDIKPEREVVEETAIAPEATVEPEVSPITEALEEPATEATVPVTEEKPVTVEETVQEKAQPTETDVVVEQKPVEAKVESAPKAEPEPVVESKDVPVTEKKITEAVAPVAEEKAAETKDVSVKEEKVPEEKLAETESVSADEKKEADE